jgi:hypothetical protein
MKMRVLVVHDRSAGAEAAVTDLQRAGPGNNNVEAIVPSLAELWLPARPQSVGVDESSLPTRHRHYLLVMLLALLRDQQAMRNSECVGYVRPIDGWGARNSTQEIDAALREIRALA